MKENFFSAIEKIVEEDPRYKPEAYEFVMRALFYTQKTLKRKSHVAGKELLEGIRDLCLEEFGPMARTVVEHWGIKTTEDFGNIVFNMVNKKIMSKTEEDTIADFRDIYDFKEAFDNTYRRQLESELKKTKDL